MANSGMTYCQALEAIRKDRSIITRLQKRPVDAVNEPDSETSEEKETP